MTRAHTCNECYFRHKGLCALDRTEICPTFRLMRRGRMTPPPQPPLLERPVETPYAVPAGVAASA